MSIEIRVPVGSAEEYEEAIARAAVTCPVRDQPGLKVDFRVVVAGV